jgi:hypothetical protein
MKIFGVNASCLSHRPHTCGVREGLRCTPWPKHSSQSTSQLTDGTWQPGVDARRPPGLTPTRLALAVCCLRTWPDNDMRLGAKGHVSTLDLNPAGGRSRRDGACGSS